MAKTLALVLAAVLVAGCNSDSNPEMIRPVEAGSENKSTDRTVDADEISAVSTVATKEQEAQIRALVDQLVFAKGDAKNKPVISPGITDDSEAYRKRFETCQTAFQQLHEFNDIAFPILVEHIDDKRQSINFRNHHISNSVGDACYWIIYFQLQDRPRDYSRYGYSRVGQDGEDHPKPYWEGTPFDDAGGLRDWLAANRDLTYTQKQIKCLEWLLAKEKTIGVPDADSYFLNILPLEIRILERRLKNGEDVEFDLDRLRKIKADKLADEIPEELLPDQ